MAVVHATTTRSFNAYDHHGRTLTTVLVQRGTRITFDPAKYVHTAQPVSLPGGRRVWASIAALNRSIDINAAEIRRQHLGNPRTRGGQARTRRDLAIGQGVIIREPGLYFDRFGSVVRFDEGGTYPIGVRVYMGEGRTFVRGFKRTDLRVSGNDILGSPCEGSLILPS